MILKHADYNSDIDGAIRQMEAETSLTPIGVKSRFPKLNRAMMRCFRFDSVVTLAGPSGSGKSYMANILRSDFTDKYDLEVDISGIASSAVQGVLAHGEFVLNGTKLFRKALNSNVDFEVANLHFGYDMQNRGEIIRTLSTLTGHPYEYFLSAQAIAKDGNDYVYNKVSADELELFRRIMKAYKERRRIAVFPVPGTLSDMYSTIAYYQNKHPNWKIFVTLDHALLSKKSNEKDDFELHNETIKVLTRARNEFGILVLPIIQTNSEMEKESRINNPASHYPSKIDLYMGGQFFQGSDFVMVMIQPAKYKIAEYGPKKLPTTKLIHTSMIKSRYLEDGEMWMLNKLNEGKIVTAEQNEVTGAMIEVGNLTR